LQLGQHPRQLQPQTHVGADRGGGAGRGGISCCICSRQNLFEDDYFKVGCFLTKARSVRQVRVYDRALLVAITIELVPATLPGVTSACDLAYARSPSLDLSAPVPSPPAHSPLPPCSLSPPLSRLSPPL
jgi:hypothetical protein